MMSNYNKNIKKLLKGKITEFTYSNKSAEPELYPQVSEKVLYAYHIMNGVKVYTKSVIPIHGGNGTTWSSNHNSVITLSTEKVL